MEAVSFRRFSPDAVSFRQCPPRLLRNCCLPKFVGTAARSWHTFDDGSFLSATLQGLRASAMMTSIKIETGFEETKQAVL